MPRLALLSLLAALLTTAAAQPYALRLDDRSLDDGVTAQALSSGLHALAPNADHDIVLFTALVTGGRVASIDESRFLAATAERTGRGLTLGDARVRLSDEYRERRAALSIRSRALAEGAFHRPHVGGPVETAGGRADERALLRFAHTIDPEAFDAGASFVVFFVGRADGDPSRTELFGALRRRPTKI